MTPIDACRFALKYHRMLVENGRDGFPGQLVHALETAVMPLPIATDEELIDCPKCGRNEWHPWPDHPEAIECVCGHVEFA